MGIHASDASGVRDLDKVEKLPSACGGRSFSHSPVKDEGFAYLPSYAVGGIEMFTRFLKDHADLGTSDSGELGFRSAEELPPAKADLPAVDPSRRRGESEHAPTGKRLARARLSD
jgi:hypothetical protein